MYCYWLMIVSILSENNKVLIPDLLIHYRYSLYTTMIYCMSFIVLKNLYNNTICDQHCLAYCISSHL